MQIKSIWIDTISMAILLCLITIIIGYKWVSWRIFVAIMMGIFLKAVFFKFGHWIGSGLLSLFLVFLFRNHVKKTVGLITIWGLLFLGLNLGAFFFWKLYHIVFPEISGLEKLYEDFSEQVDTELKAREEAWYVEDDVGKFNEMIDNFSTISPEDSCQYLLKNNQIIEYNFCQRLLALAKEDLDLCDFMTDKVNEHYYGDSGYVEVSTANWCKTKIVWTMDSDDLCKELSAKPWENRFKTTPQAFCKDKYRQWKDYEESLKEGDWVSIGGSTR